MCRVSKVFLSCRFGARVIAALILPSVSLDIILLVLSFSTFSRGLNTPASASGLHTAHGLYVAASLTARLYYQKADTHQCRAVPFTCPSTAATSAVSSTNLLPFDCCILCGTSSAGFWSKNPLGFRLTVIVSQGITG